GCFNSGHIEPAVAVIGGMNLAGLAFGLAHCRTMLERVKVISRMAVSTLLFLGLTAPVWLSFLTALDGAYSDHMKVQATQLPLETLLGAFDDVFFRLPLQDDTMAATAPGVSFLIAVGSIFAALRWRQLQREPFFWINSTAIVLWSACIFKL